jgi:transcriptional regulator with XRE-family HTH domain
MSGLAIRKIRKTKKIPQWLLAKQIGWHQCQLSKVENGKRKISTEELTKLAHALGVKPSDLLDDAAETPQATGTGRTTGTG